MPIRPLATVLMTVLTVLCPFLPCEECCSGCDVEGDQVRVGSIDSSEVDVCCDCCSTAQQQVDGKRLGRKTDEQVTLRDSRQEPCWLPSASVLNDSIPGDCDTGDCDTGDKSPGRRCPSSGKLLNCFCGGAVLFSSIDLPDGDSFSTFIDRSIHTPRLPVELQACCGTGAYSRQGSTHFPPLIVGRSLCVITGTWLL